MTALATFLFTVVIVGFFWHIDRSRLKRSLGVVKRHWQSDRAAWVAISDEWQARYDEQTGAKYEAEAKARKAIAELEWARVTIAVQAADADMRYDILAEHRAKVLPMRGAL